MTDIQQHQGISQLVEHLFRHESARMVATLTGIFGLEHLTLAEDVVQEALVRALQTWPFYRGAAAASREERTVNAAIGETIMSETFTCGDHGALVSYLYDECTPAERRIIS